MSYKELKTQVEIERALELIDSWKDPALPARQWRANIKEYEALRQGGDWLEVPPFRAFVGALKECYTDPRDSRASLLEIGCSSAYYSQVLMYAGFQWQYTGVDYSPHFKDFAAKVYPGVHVDVGDALALPYPDASFDVVVSGCCLLHMKDWQAAIKEAARVSKRYVMFHRTPLLAVKPTTYWLKEAYGVPLFEIWFGQREFWEAVGAAGLIPRHVEPVFVTEDHGGYGHFSILTEKRS